MVGGLNVRNIRKGTEPQCLAAHRRTPHAGYDNLPRECKDELKRRMWLEQGGLCCYCMSKITAENAHIEHWSPQADGKAALDYDNLLLVCDGGANSGGVIVHCDTSKSDRSLKYNPADSRHDVELLIQYLANGRIECRGDAEFNDQISDVLNLNAPYLRAVRKKIVDVTKQRIQGCELSELRKLEKRALQLKTDETLEGFCMVAAYYIKKKIQKKTFQKNAGRK